MTDRAKRQKQFHGVSDTQPQANERTCTSPMVEAHFSSTTAENINQIETNENLIDVQINVVGLNNLGNLSEKSNVKSEGATSSSDDRPMQQNKSFSSNINQGNVDHQLNVVSGTTFNNECYRQQLNGCPSSRSESCFK